MDGKKLADLLWEIADLPARPFDNTFDGTGIKFTVESANLVSTIATLASESKELAKVLMDTKVVSTDVTPDQQTIVMFYGIAWPDGFQGYGDEPFDDEFLDLDEEEEDLDDDEV